MAYDTPSYYKFYADTWRVVSSLPKAKAAKLLYAMNAYFFDGTEPADGELPAVAQKMFDMNKANIASYRRNALNGTKNRKSQNKTNARVVTEPDDEPTSKTSDVLSMVLEGVDDCLPAETQKVGGEHSGKQPGKSASNIINHQSLITPSVASAPPSAERCGCVSQPHKKDSDTLSALTGAIADRAGADAPRGRDAALPTLEEYQRVSLKLEDEGIDALTERDREIYHAGHAAYAASA